MSTDTRTPVPSRACAAVWTGGLSCQRTDEHDDSEHRTTLFGRPVTFSSDTRPGSATVDGDPVLAAIYADAVDPDRECLCPLVHSTPTGLDYCRRITAPGHAVCAACVDCEAAPVFIAPTDVIPATEIVDGDYIVLPVDPRSIDDEADGSTVILVDRVRETRDGRVILSGAMLHTDDRICAVFDPWDRVWITYDRATLGEDA